MPEGGPYDLQALLRACNPRWQGAPATALASEQGGRFAHAARLARALLSSATPIVALIEGTRQTGKSTSLACIVDVLQTELRDVHAACLVRLADTPLRWCEIAAVHAAWQAAFPSTGRHILLIDDVDLLPDAQLDVLQALLAQGDLQLVIASARPCLTHAHWARGGRHVAHLHLRTANFAEFIASQDPPISWPAAPQSLRLLFERSPADLAQTGTQLRPLQLAFLRYLAHGGYPGARSAPDPEAAQRYLRDELITRHLRWDAPARHGVRRGNELERTLDYLATRTGSLLDVPELCAHLSVERPTAREFIHLLESLGLLHRIPPLGYGQNVQRARFLICLADPALPAALLWQSLSAPGVLEAAAYGALQRHVRGAYAARGAAIHFAGGSAQRPLLVVGAGAQCVPFALQFAPRVSSTRDFATAARLCSEHGVARAYFATRLSEDIGPLLDMQDARVSVMRLPLALLCLWLSAAETDGFTMA